MIALLLFAVPVFLSTCCIEILLQRRYVRMHAWGSIRQLVGVHFLGFLLFIFLSLLSSFSRQDGFLIVCMLYLLFAALMIAYGASAIGGEDSPSAVLLNELQMHDGLTLSEIVAAVKNQNMVESRVTQLFHAKILERGKQGFFVSSQGRSIAFICGCIRKVYGVPL